MKKANMLVFINDENENIYLGVIDAAEITEEHRPLVKKMVKSLNHFDDEDDEFLDEIVDTLVSGQSYHDNENLEDYCWKYVNLYEEGDLK